MVTGKEMEEAFPKIIQIKKQTKKEEDKEN